MATAQCTCLEQIGDTAGVLWHYLNDHGPRTVSQLAKDVDAPRDVIMQAVGWLAREGKVSIEEDRGKKTVGLRS
jgi:predicted ArsR family transcriptional regulator